MFSEGTRIFPPMALPAPSRLDAPQDTVTAPPARTCPLANGDVWRWVKQLIIE